MTSVVTRFAPSPTGMLHIGGARTALFNYLFSKKYGGSFLLRIEDTDKKRSTGEAVDEILKGMKWLGIHWDGEIVHQSSRIERHQEIAKKLIENGTAYYAYDNQEEIAFERETTTKNGKIYRYNPKWRNPEQTIPSDIKPTIRLKIPAGKTKWNDLIRGDIEFDNFDIEDFVILRSDGIPTYMLAVVSDDIDMKITHIIRGDDHISNTPKQILIYKALGIDQPLFGHIPLIYDIEGQKLSKRKGAVAVSDYQKMGYLPEAVLSYLMQLGWSSKTNPNQIMALEDATKIFDISELGKSPARFDFDKLNFINLQYIQNKSDLEIAQIVKCHIEQDGVAVSDEEFDSLKKIAPEIKKLSTINDIVAIGKLFLHKKIERELDAEDLIKNNKEIIDKLFEFIKNIDNVDNFKSDFDLFLKNESLKFNKAGPLLRSILIGKTSSISLAQIVYALGKDVCINRFQLC